jgi:hypothetical protein
MTRHLPEIYDITAAHSVTQQSSTAAKRRENMRGKWIAEKYRKNRTAVKKTATSLPMVLLYLLCTTQRISAYRFARNGRSSSRKQPVWKVTHIW